jgi:hypothetical protein
MVLLTRQAPPSTPVRFRGPPFVAGFGFSGFWVRRLLSQRGGIGTAWLVRLTDGLASLQGRFILGSRQPEPVPPSAALLSPADCVKDRS